MTRAREKLYVSACLPQENYERVRESWTSAGEEDSMFARSYLDWVAPAAMKSTHWEISEVRAKPEITETEVETWMPELQEEEEAVSVNWEDRFSFSYPYEEETTVPGKFSVTELKRMHALEEDTASFVKLAKKPKFAEEMKKGFTNAEKGSIIHTILEHMDFRTATKEKLPEILADMVQKGILSAQETEAIDCSMIEAFLQSSVFKRMQNADVLYRETPFTYLKPIGEIMEGYAGEESTMVQGIIDCVIEEEDGVVVVDFKTDAVKTAEELSERYKKQLDIYSAACEKIFGKRVLEKYIYSFALGSVIKL
jgi:ATP-dependent helicase/nuclease subunit A